MSGFRKNKKSIRAFDIATLDVIDNPRPNKPPLSERYFDKRSNSNYTTGDERPASGDKKLCLLLAAP